MTTCRIVDFGRARMAMVERDLPNGFIVTFTKHLKAGEVPDWPQLLATFGEIPPDALPEAQ